MNRANKVIEEIVKQVESSLGAPLSEEEVNEIYQWQKAMALREITSLYGWDVLKEMFQDYANDASKEFEMLKEQDPFKVKDKLAVQHNYAYTVNRVIGAILGDVEDAVQLMDKPPETVKKAALRIKTAGQ
jgi:hypothetical protein